MVEEILALKKKGLTIKQIAKETNSTVGKVQYRLRKWHALKSSMSAPGKEKDPVHSNIHSTEKIRSSYEQDHIVLLPKGPNCIFAYWDLQTLTCNMVSHHFSTSWSDLNKKLRIYDVSDLIFNGHNSHWFCDVSLPEMTNNWFFNDLEDNRTYIVDFGIQPEANDFFTILRSIPIETARINGSSNRHSELVKRWQSGGQSQPDWYEHFSTYSVYSQLK